MNSRRISEIMSSVPSTPSGYDIIQIGFQDWSVTYNGQPIIPTSRFSQRRYAVNAACIDDYHRNQDANNQRNADAE